MASAFASDSRSSGPATRALDLLPGAALFRRFNARRKGSSLLDACERGGLEKARRLIKGGVDLEWAPSPLKSTVQSYDAFMGWLGGPSPVMHEIEFLIGLTDAESIRTWADESADASASVAAFNGREDILSLLIDAGADVDRRNCVGRTALMIAADKGRYGCVALLIQAGADVNAQDRAGFTAATWAALKLSFDCLELLIQAGADLSIADSTNTTAVDWAVRRGGAEAGGAVRAALADFERASLAASAPSPRMTTSPARKSL